MKAWARFRTIARWRSEATMSEKRSGRGGVLAEHLFSALSSACVLACPFVHLFCLSVDWQVLFDMCCHSRLARRVTPESSTCVIASCCLVCSVLYARYTDAFNDSPRFPIRHEHKWYSVLVYVPSIQKVVVVIALDTSSPGEVLCFVCLSGDQYWTLPGHRVSNLDTDLKGTWPSG